MLGTVSPKRPAAHCTSCCFQPGLGLLARLDDNLLALGREPVLGRFGDDALPRQINLQQQLFRLGRIGRAHRRTTPLGKRGADQQVLDRHGERLRTALRQPPLGPTAVVADVSGPAQQNRLQLLDPRADFFGPPHRRSPQLLQLCGLPPPDRFPFRLLTLPLLELRSPFALRKPLREFPLDTSSLTLRAACCLASSFSPAVSSRSCSLANRAAVCRSRRCMSCSALRASRACSACSRFSPAALAFCFGGEPRSAARAVTRCQQLVPLDRVNLNTPRSAQDFLLPDW